ncbi:MAG TPA: hypothetical protein VLE23_06710 [Geminicoccaceae bacterium]|nr:hypothetical protein [Geminicoccaceae bacterium]
MRSAPWPILLAAALTAGGGAGCRGPGYYADKPPLEIAEMVDVNLAGFGPGEAGYTAPAISGRRSYRLAGRKDLDTGQIIHKLRLAETGSGEERYLDWARAAADARVCALTNASLAAGLVSNPAEQTSFMLVDERASCHPHEECETYERNYKKKYKDEDGDTKTKIVERVFRDCEDYWRCQSERIYEVAIDDRSLREASPLDAGMNVRLRWDCGRLGERADDLELPASYLQGYLLAVDGYPYTPLPVEPAP